MNFKYINYFFAGFVILVSIVWVGFLLFSSHFLSHIPQLQKNILIGILLLYAAYRAYRLVVMARADKRNSQSFEDEEESI